MIKVLKIVMGLIVTITSTISASNAQQEIYSIKVVARAGKQDIKLRWAPDNAIAWQRLNNYGYTIERVTVARDNKLLEPVESKNLTDLPLKPTPVNDWEEMAEVDDYAAVSAQAIYGETFELTENYSSDIVQIIQKSQELEQRFSFAVFSADQSFEVAMMSGLAFIDHTAKSNERYLYRIKSAVPNDVENIQTGSVYIGLDEYEELPAIYDLQVEFADQSALLSWERKNFDGIYNSFLVEKSVDGNTFRSITEKPIVNTSSEEQVNGRRAYKLDSLSENGVIVSYRVRGINAFGEISPPSDTVSGTGVIKLYKAPTIIDWSTDNSQAEIIWEYESSESIKGFRVERSANTYGPFEVLSDLQPDIFTFIDSQPLATNYYRVLAYNESNAIASFPVLIQIEDSIPPAIPEGLNASIDSSGVVSLSWQPNEENDLLGYRVYRSNFKNSEFAQITNEAITVNKLIDTLKIDNLSSKVYYKVLSVDKRFNPSEKSAPFEVIKPDILPPVPPLFKNVKSQFNGVYLEWVPSSSEDVSSHHLYRRNKNSRSWTLIKTFEDSTFFYSDTTMALTSGYQYTIIAMDRSGLESTPVKPVWGKKIESGIRPAITSINFEIDPNEKSLKLFWEYDENGVSSFIIYRTVNDDPLTLYSSLSADNYSFEDSRITINSNYSYRIKAVFFDGSESLLSQPVEVKY